MVYAYAMTLPAPPLNGELITADRLPAPSLGPQLIEWDSAPTPHPAYQALMALLNSANSQRTYRGHLKKAAQLLCEQHRASQARYLITDANHRSRFRDPGLVARLPWHQLRVDTVQWLKAQATVRDEQNPIHISNPASVNGLIHTLRGIAREAFKLQLMSGDDYQRIRLVPLITYERLPAGRSVRVAELNHLVHALLEDTTPAGRRDTAILGLLYAGGLRRAELAALTLADIHQDEKQGPYLRVLGKGNRERKVFIEPGAYQALGDWLVLRGTRPGALFCRILKSGTLSMPTGEHGSVPGVSRKRSTMWCASANSRRG